MAQESSVAFWINPVWELHKFRLGWMLTWKMGSKMVLTGYQQVSKYRIYEVLRRARRRILFDQPGHDDTETRCGDPPEEVKIYREISRFCHHPNRQEVGAQGLQYE